MTLKIVNSFEHHLYREFGFDSIHSHSRGVNSQKVTNSLKNIRAFFHPPEAPLYKTGDIVTHQDTPHLIIGCTGHSKEVLEGDITQRELYYDTGFSAPHRYARINGKKEGCIGFLAVPMGKKHLLQHGASNSDVLYAPLTPKSMQLAELKVVAMQSASLNNDPSWTAAFKRHFSSPVT
jgi:hypothetical protein